MINMTNFPLIKHICSKMALNWTTFTCQAELLTKLLKSHFKITFPLQFNPPDKNLISSCNHFGKALVKWSVTNSMKVLQACIYKSVKTGLFLNQL